MALQATTLSELKRMLDQKVEDGCTHFSQGLMEEPRRAKTFLPMKRSVEKEQGLRLTEQLLVLQGEGEERFIQMNYSGE